MPQNVYTKEEVDVLLSDLRAELAKELTVEEKNIVIAFIDLLKAKLNIV